ncbi:hypothetical protein [Streptomyces spectabilis]|uniref:DUF2269 family protein n=1 Tax=Streptomyces spectabilis TaxID=68270 RepID=A0A5P2X7H1_STRST|nr:hypothetical protein [Streptomyces spectabilis]MBB5101659.1 hypothetical protein [Streptomyces spectabilis]MCI3900841.1 hypothetical protein [Streptomyces spectabilis]QEV58362.1 hypothetical protein CP982_06285 [Streptomyces spectabilis]GGV12793.1 membrane protein [Streptomyces spectabilis]
MSKLFLTLHVLAAIVAVGPVTVAASMFPKVLREAQAAPDDPRPVTTLRTLHRISRVYGGLGIAVVAFGFATASSMDVLGSPWLITSIGLTFLAALILLLLVLPRQETALAAVAGPESDTAQEAGGAVAVRLDARAGARLAMVTGVFNVLWATVTILMIVRPGSTTGA